MSLDIHTTYFRHTAYSAAPAEALPTDNAGLHANWREQVTAVVAASIAVLIVAVIAALMGVICILIYVASHAISKIYALKWMQNDCTPYRPSAGTG